MESKDYDVIDWDRLDRYVRKLGTFDELADLERWVESDPALKQLADAMRIVGRRPNAGEPGWDERSAWAELRARMRATPVRPIRIAKSSGEWRAAGAPSRRLWGSGSSNWAGAAAAFLLLLGSAAVAVWVRDRSPGGAAAPVETSRVVATGRGERREIRFDDGTVITLGAASEMHYVVGVTERRVELTGLANFRVAHDSTRPFTVRAGNSLITDLGTEFSVRAYANDSRIEVAVRSGRVAWRAQADSARSTELGSGDAGIRDSSGVVAVHHDTTAVTTSQWMSGRLAFQDQTLLEVGAELSRWFDVDVRFADARVATCRVTAVFGDPALSSVLDALSASVGVTYVRSGRTVTFSSKSP
jgi:transmembrane sensor